MLRALVAIAWIILWILVVAGFVAGEAVWFAEPDVRPGDLASIETHLVKQLNEAATGERLAAAALVLLHDRRIVAQHGFGVANGETGAPVDPERSLFIVGSVSKAVTAWGVMKLVQDGRIALDEPVMPHLTRWRFPGSEAHRDKVTVRHLLSHTAGIAEGFGFIGFAPESRVPTLEEWLTLPVDVDGGAAHGARVSWEPGTAMSYSSAGYGILQLLVEEVTGQSFDPYMREAVLVPLGMTHSSFDLEAIIAAGHSKDLTANYDGDRKATPHRRYAAQAPVSFRTSAVELGRFLVAHTCENPVLMPQTLKQMSTPQPGTGDSWGLGETLYAKNYWNQRIVGHSGGVYPASGASIRVNPATGNGFVLLVAGSRGATNQLVHDWTYWETGEVTPDARRQLVQNRARAALIAVIAGVAVILFWRWRTLD